MHPDHPSQEPPGTSSASLPTGLLRDGWVPYRFPDSNIVVILPPPRVAKFGDMRGNRALYASFPPGNKIDFTATLHARPGFTKRRELALDFVANLAKKKNAQAIDVATYRYFADPKIGGDGPREHHYWVIGIPARSSSCRLRARLELRSRRPW